MDGTRPMDGTRAGFVHTAVCHRSTDELVDAVLPFVEEGLARTEPVFVNLSAERIAALRAALDRKESNPGSAGAALHWSDASRWHPHPHRRLRGIGDLVRAEERHGSRRFRFLGECAWPDGPPALVEEWERFESVLNHAFADAPLTMVCAYDATALPAEVVEHAQATHPMLGATHPVTSPNYVAAERFCARPRAELVPVPKSARYAGPEVTPSEARALVRALAQAGERDAAPLTRARADDLAVAVTEIVANSWHAGAQRVELWCWQRDGEVGAQVEDDGPGWTDPLAGYRRPGEDVESGRGLWVARQLADVVQIRSGASGTVVQVLMLDPARSAA